MIRSFLHRHIWQRLPHRARRRALQSLTTAFAPRPDADARREGPFIVAGCLRSNTGLGQSARLCHDALLTSGFDVRGIDLTQALFQSPDNGDFTFRDAGGLIGPGILILHVNAPLMPLALAHIGRTTAARKWIVGYWAWELEKTPPDWHIGTRFVHEVWAPSTFTARAIAGQLPQTVPLRVVPHPVALSAAAAQGVSASPDKPFTALSILDASSSLARKNPLGVIAAFRSAFGDDPGARLMLKVSNLDRAGSHAAPLGEALRGATTITLIDRALAQAEMEDLFAQADVLLSLHRSEGFGLTIAEAMLRAIPVVGVRWSGEADFFDETVGLVVRHNLMPARDPQGTYDFATLSWADADIGDASAKLRALRHDPVRRAELGEAARRRALRLWSAENYAKASAGR